MTENNDGQARTWGMWTHLSSLVWIPLAFVGLAFPILNIVAPLIVWLVKKNDHPFIDQQGKESLNFQISLTLYSFVGVIALIVIGLIFGVSLGTAQNSGQALIALFFGVGFVWLIILLGIISLVQLILVVFAAIKASNGEFYRYPLTIRFLS